MKEEKNMRMGFIFSEIFWGLLLVVLGLAAILRSFDIHIPIFRLIVAFFLIYLGVSMLLGTPMFDFNYRDAGPGNVIFREAQITAEDFREDEINFIFGSGEVDFRGIPAEEIQTREINVIFGSTTLILDPEQLVEFDISSVFGSARLPDGNSISFGDYNYRSPGLEAETAELMMDLSVVFGSLEIILR